jgi:hypothetical protein
MDETRLTRFALDAVYASIGSRKLCRDASTCPGTRQRHGSARQHGSQRFRQPRTAWSASRKCSLRRQDKATSHCVVVGFIWPRGQHETAGMQSSGERGRAQRRTLLGYGHRELKQEGRPLLAQSGHFWIFARDGLSANDPKRTSGKPFHGRVYEFTPEVGLAVCLRASTRREARRVRV